jgi:hypothetical protein
MRETRELEIENSPSVTEGRISSVPPSRDRGRREWVALGSVKFFKSNVTWGTLALSIHYMGARAEVRAGGGRRKVPISLQQACNMPATWLQLARCSGTAEVIPRWRSEATTAFLQRKGGAPASSGLRCARREGVKTSACRTLRGARGTQRSARPTAGAWGECGSETFVEGRE